MIGREIRPHQPIFARPVTLPVCRVVARSKPLASSVSSLVRKPLKPRSLPVCHQHSASSANWHTVPACQLATPVRAASGKLSAGQLQRRQTRGGCR
jgi:hypothetical protein